MRRSFASVRGSLDAIADGDLVIRVTNLAQGMQANIRILAADGKTILADGNFSEDDSDYFLALLSASAGNRYYIEISHVDGTATTGTYAVSAGPPRVSEQPDPPGSGRSTIYLPFVGR